MAEVKAGVLLSLRDQFSQGIKSAGSASQAFADKTKSALSKVDGMLSGTAAKLGALGISLSLGAAAKEIIDLDADVMRIGVQADISNDKVTELKNAIFETANTPTIKISTADLVSGLDQVIERTGDMDFAVGNLEAMALAVRATGASGEAIGGMFTEFQKMGLGAEEAMSALDTLTVQGKAGAFTLENLAVLGPRTISAYTATGRSGTGALREMGAALQVIRMGTGSSEQAATAFEAVMRSLTAPDKQAKLRQLGISVRDSEGGFRSITEIQIVGSVAEIKNSILVYNTDRTGTEDISGEQLPAPFRTRNNEHHALLMFLAEQSFVFEYEAVTVKQAATKEALENLYKTAAYCAAGQLIVSIGPGTYQRSTGYWGLFEKLERSINQDDVNVFRAVQTMRISTSAELAAKNLSLELKKKVQLPLPLLHVALYLGCDNERIRDLNALADSFLIKGDVIYV